MKVDYWSSTKKIQLKGNSAENSADKNLKEDSKFNEQWNFSIKQQKKKKEEKKNSRIQRTLTQISFPETALKFR